MFRAPAQALTREDLLWVVGSFCAIHRKPFDPELFPRQFPPPYTTDTFTINQLKGRATILFIAHALPKNLQIDEGVRLGTGTLGAVGAPHERISEAKPQERAAQLA